MDIDNLDGQPLGENRTVVKMNTVEELLLQNKINEAETSWGTFSLDTEEGYRLARYMLANAEKIMGSVREANRKHE